MYKDKIVLCGANAYEKKYYFNEDFSALPQSIQDELHIMCVLYTEEISGVLPYQTAARGEKGASGIPGTLLPGIFPGRRCRGVPERRGGIEHAVSD